MDFFQNKTRLKLVPLVVGNRDKKRAFRWCLFGMPQDGTAYIICRGFCRCEFEAMEGAEILRKSIMVSRLSAFSVRMARLVVKKHRVMNKELKRICDSQK